MKYLKNLLVEKTFYILKSIYNSRTSFPTYSLKVILGIKRFQTTHEGNIMLKILPYKIKQFKKYIRSHTIKYLRPIKYK